MAVLILNKKYHILNKIIKDIKLILMLVSILRLKLFKDMLHKNKSPLFK